ncbi:protease complex subunit PrcB family protein [Flavobacterium sp. GA093]|uniref:Protease complex subunit PrcB family protein n=1 Tax=Flavobacterium hydrocarbonoxydans TaxID=2683249 RepID=A0A6I4NRN7_9FLAO|nr:protease complex subunit PrcB family protein [Flavobacterium hydrocarbonoxydans]MWB96791.1 protease complex subunit PrcB family protein [Flavobacterium hydrocarbonoxydans]
MKKIMLCLFMALGLSACSLGTDEIENNCGSEAIVAFSGFPLSCNYSVKENPTNPTPLLVSTQEKMDSFFTKHANSCPTASDPNIDFTKNYLVGLFAGAKPTSGYAIKMTAVIENNCQIVINYFEKSPLPGETTNNGTTYPSDFILIPKSSKPIYFNKVPETTDAIIIGNFKEECTGSDCLKFYQLNNYNVLNFLNVGYNNYNFSQYRHNVIAKYGELPLFLKSVPTEIINLKGQSKTYGTPDSDGQGGVYFELRQGFSTTTIKIDNNDTEDQSTEIKAFKNAIKAKITALKTN